MISIYLYRRIMSFSLVLTSVYIPLNIWGICADLKNEISNINAIKLFLKTKVNQIY